MNWIKTKIGTWWYVFKRSIFEPRYYLDVLKAPFSFSLKFIISTFLLFGLLQMVVFAGFVLSRASTLRTDLPRLRGELIAAYPRGLEFTIKDGKLTSTSKQPFYVSLPSAEQDEQMKHIFVLDTRADESKYAQYRSFVLLTDDHIVFPSSSGDVVTGQKQKLSEVVRENIVVNEAFFGQTVSSLAQYLNTYYWWIVVWIVGTLMIFGTMMMAGVFLVMHLISLALYTLALWIGARITSRPMSYARMYQLAMHVSIAPFLLSRLFGMIDGAPAVPVFPIFFTIWMVVVLNNVMPARPPHKR